MATFVLGLIRGIAISFICLGLFGGTYSAIADGPGGGPGILVDCIDIQCDATCVTNGALCTSPCSHCNCTKRNGVKSCSPF